LQKLYFLFEKAGKGKRGTPIGKKAGAHQFSKKNSSEGKKKRLEDQRERRGGDAGGFPL